MISIILGIIAFIILYIFDLNKIFWRQKIINVFFAVGVITLGIATWLLYRSEEYIFLPYQHSIYFLILAVISLVLMFYALFFALPFKKTYMKTTKNQVVDYGLYALCRHPGVIFFSLFYLFLYLSNFGNTFLCAFLLWTIMDIFHVWIQDRFLFSKTLVGYDGYKKKVPFLIPTFKSFKNMFKGD